MAYESIKNAKSLEDLLIALRDHDGDQTLALDILMTSLQTFGGDAPRSTIGVWSWDAQSLLIGDCMAEMRIVRRGE